MLYTGVVDQNIDSAIPGFGVVHHGFNLLDVTQVRIVIARRFTPFRDFVSCRFTVAETVKNQLRAGLRQHASDPKSNTAGRAGHQCGFTVQIHFILLTQCR